MNNKNKKNDMDSLLSPPECIHFGSTTTTMTLSSIPTTTTVPMTLNGLFLAASATYGRRNIMDMYPQQHMSAAYAPSWSITTTTSVTVFRDHPSYSRQPLYRPNVVSPTIHWIHHDNDNDPNKEESSYEKNESNFDRKIPRSRHACPIRRTNMVSAILDEVLAISNDDDLVEGSIAPVLTIGYHTAGLGEAHRSIHRGRRHSRRYHHDYYHRQQDNGRD